MESASNLAPRPAATGDPAYASYLAQCAVGPPCRIELYPGLPRSEAVEQVSVRKIKDGAYRGLILWRATAGQPDRLIGIESSREEVRRWLTSNGIPCVRIAPPKA